MSIFYALSTFVEDVKPRSELEAEVEVVSVFFLEERGREEN